MVSTVPSALVVVSGLGIGVAVAAICAKQVGQAVCLRLRHTAMDTSEAFCMSVQSDLL